MKRTQQVTNVDLPLYNKRREAKKAQLLNPLQGQWLRHLSELLSAFRAFCSLKVSPALPSVPWPCISKFLPI